MNLRRYDRTPAATDPASPRPAASLSSVSPRPLRFAAAGALVTALTGCSMVSSTTSASQVRIIDATSAVTAVDVYQGSNILAYNLGLGSVTSYIQIAPGSYAINVDTAGSRQAIVTATGSFLVNQQYTVLIGTFSNGIAETILKDQSQPAASGQVSLRVLNQAANLGSVDLYLVPSSGTLVTASALLSGFAFGANSGYLSVPAGTYTLVALPAGTVPTATGTTLYTGTTVTNAAGVARTIVLLNTQVTTTPALQVVIARDYDPPTSS